MFLVWLQNVRLSALLIVLGLGVSGHLWAAESYPETELRAVESPEERQIRLIRDSEIKQLQLVLSRKNPKRRRADLYFRLSEIHLEEYRATFLLEGRAHERRIAQGRKAKSILRGASRVHLKRGIEVCNEIVRLKISYPNMDRVIYFLGYYYGEQGNLKKSEAAYRQLVQQYPNSPTLMEAYSNLGNYAYNASRYNDAEQNYTQAVKRSNQDKQALLLHKLAWTQYRLRRYSEAIKTMKQAVTVSQAGGEKFVSIQDEAIRDLSLFMAERIPADEAVRYFESLQVSPPTMAASLNRLAAQYQKKGQVNNAAIAYEAALRVSTPEQSLENIVKLVEMDLRQLRYKKALQRIQGISWPKTFNTQSSVSAKNLKALSRKTATSNHDSYRNKKRKNSLLVAEAYYELTLRGFEGTPANPSDDEQTELEMYLAEVKLERKKYSDATQLYARVAKSNNKKFNKTAARLLVDTLSRQIQVSGPKKATQRRQNQAPDFTENRFVQSVDQLTQFEPNSAETRKANLVAAQLLAGYSTTLDGSIDRCRQIIERWPASRESLIAARLWLQIYEDQLPSTKNSSRQNLASVAANLRGAINVIQSNRALVANDRKSNQRALMGHVENLEQQISVREIAASERDQDFKSAGDQYIELARKSDKQSVAERAYRNGIENFIRLKEFDKAAQLNNEWYKKFPSSSLQRNYSGEFATRLFIEGRFQLAARQFFDSGVQQNSSTSVLTAGRIYEAIGSRDDAKRVYRHYVQKYQRSGSRAGVFLRLARIAQASNEEKEVVESFDQCIQQGAHFDAAECGARLGDFYLGLKDTKSALQSYKKVIELKPEGKGKKRRWSPYVGYSMYRQIEIQEGKIDLLPLVLDQKKLRQGMEKRISLIQRLNKKYSGVVRVGGPWGVAALHRLAQRIQEFSDEIRTLVAKEKNAAQGLVLASNLSQQARDAWRQAYKEAMANEILSPELPNVVSRLADLRERVPFRAQGFRGRFRLIGKTGDGSKSDSVLKFVREQLTKNPNNHQLWLDYGNLLTESSFSSVAEIAYDRAIAIKPKYTDALNNQGVLLLRAGGQEEWDVALKAREFFNQALALNPVDRTVKFNLAALYNYYGLYNQGKSLWEQVLVAENSRDARDGLGIALQGMGRLDEATKEFERAEDLGADDNRWTHQYHLAARRSTKGKRGAEQCLDILDDLDGPPLKGFEHMSTQNLRTTCNRWKPKDD